MSVHAGWSHRPPVVADNCNVRAVSTQSTFHNAARLRLPSPRRFSAVCRRDYVLIVLRVPRTWRPLGTCGPADR